MRAEAKKKRRSSSTAKRDFELYFSACSRTATAACAGCWFVELASCNILAIYRFLRDSCGKRAAPDARWNSNSLGESPQRTTARACVPAAPRRTDKAPMEPTDEASVSNRFDAFLGELDGLTPTTEKQIEKRLRELRNVKRGKPARKPTKKRQQRAAAKKLARPLNPVKKPEAPVTQEPSTSLPPLAPANKEAASHRCPQANWHSAQAVRAEVKKKRRSSSTAKRDFELYFSARSRTATAGLRLGLLVCGALASCSILAKADGTGFWDAACGERLPQTPGGTPIA